MSKHNMQPPCPASVLKDVTDYAGWHVRDNTRIENAKDKSL